MAARLYGNRKLFYFLHKATLEISIEANARAYITAIRSILSFDCEIWLEKVEDIKKLSTFFDRSS